MKFIIAVIAFSFLSFSAQASGRLPGGIIPENYDIEVHPDAAKLTFSGSEVITLRLTRPSSSLTLNAADLAITKASIDGVGDAKITLNPLAQTVTLEFAKSLKPARYKLALAYTGKIYESASGLFAVDYANADGSKERMLVTQFEAPNARRFAPMWDEPAFKATFTLRAAAPQGQTAFSNMPVVKTENISGDKTLWHFAPSPKMSSYLLFLGMGNVERKTVMAGKTEIGIITRKGVSAQGDYALEISKKLLNYFDDYFGTPYPLPKLDMIAAPGSSQFFGAMENWGAILYFEPTVLLDPKLQTEGQKQNVYATVAHEIAHQWFGNIVTMAWWDDLWLNEGFASWMETKASDDLNPNWGALSQSLAFSRQGAFSLDARATTHPIVQKINTVDDISQAFDTITYSKGEAVIRMLEVAVGPQAFRTGVRNYMAKYKYKNAVTDQLWTEIAAAAGKPVAPFMHSFTRQGGVPMIEVGAPVCRNNKTELTLAQGRFGLDAASRKSQNWQVPVILSNRAAPKTLFVSGPKPVAVTLPGCGLPVINFGQSGYFKTLYSPPHFEALRASFKTLALDDQLGLTGDAYQLANGGYQPIERYLALVEGISPTAAPLLWDMVTRQLSQISNLLTDAPEQPAFNARARTLLAPLFAELGWQAKPGETPDRTLLRDALIPVLGAMGDPGIVADAARYAGQILVNPDAVSGDIRQSALDIFARYADAAQWEALLARAKAERSPVARQRYYALLGRTRDATLAQRALDLVLTEDAPAPMRTGILQSVAGGHPALAFTWASARTTQIEALLDANSRPRFIAALPTNSSDPALAARVIAFAEISPGARKAAANTAAIITYRASLRAAQSAAIAKWAAQK
jgi:aminopeptidase N